MEPTLRLHALPSSHPCLAVERALELKGLDFERIDLQPGAHMATVAELYGAGKTTVPGLMIGDEPVHGTGAILARLDQLAAEPVLFPADRADAVRAAERWGDQALQDLGRRLAFGALHFRPEALSTFGGVAPLDPAGTDFAIKYIRAAWKHRDVTAAGLADDLAELPAMLDLIDRYAADDVIAGPQATAADLHIGATLRLLLTIGDIRPLLAGRTAETVALRWFPDYPGDVPAGAFPAGWVPE